MMMTCWRAAKEGEKVCLSRKLPTYLSLSHAFVFRLCFTLNYGIIYRDRHMCEHIQTFIHDERWTFPFLPHQHHCLTRGRMSRLSFSYGMCESVFKNISTWIHHEIFIFNFSCNAHTKNIVFHCCSTFPQQLTSRFSKSRASPIFLLSNSHNRSSLIAVRNFIHEIL